MKEVMAKKKETRKKNLQVKKKDSRQVHTKNYENRQYGPNTNV